MVADACGSDTIFSRVAIDGTASPVFGDFTAADTAWQLLGGSDLKYNEESINPETLNGRIVADSELQVDGSKMWDGGYSILASPDAFFNYVPYILGGAWASGISVPTDAAPPDINLLLHKDAYLYPYINGKIATATISGEAGGPVQISLTFMGRSRLALSAGANWPSGLNVNVQSPYMFEDFVLTVDAAVVKCRRWSVTRDNKLGYRMWGSRNPSCVKRDGRAVTTINLTMPHSTDTVPLFVNHDPKVKRAILLTGTHPTPTMSCIISLPYTQIPAKDPPVSGSEILLETTGTARGYTGLREISITNDNTP